MLATMVELQRKTSGSLPERKGEEDAKDRPSVGGDDPDVGRGQRGCPGGQQDRH
jgi:hypothetical protein